MSIKNAHRLEAYATNDAGGIRTRNREGLSFAAVPVRVPRRH